MSRIHEEAVARNPPGFSGSKRRNSAKRREMTSSAHRSTLVTRLRFLEPWRRKECVRCLLFLIRVSFTGRP